VTDISPAIAARLGNFIRLLSSDRDGEVVAAARALIRTLHSAGADIHVLAERIEKPGLTQAEMQKIFDAGYHVGLRVAEAKFHGDDDFRDIDGIPPWDKVARWCQHHSDRLRANERKFVNDMAARAVWRALTPKQEKWLRSIFLKLGGKMS
jgi:hypothetical protein